MTKYVKLFYSRLQYLWCGLSLQSSTLGLRVLSSSLVWATFSGHSLSLRALFRDSISISVWKISCRVWTTTDTERNYRKTMNCKAVVVDLSVSFMKITGQHSRWWLQGWKRTNSEEGKSQCLRRSSKKLHIASFWISWAQCCSVQTHFT